METLRRTVLFGTEMAKAQCNTIRVKLFAGGGGHGVGALDCVFVVECLPDA